MSLVWDQWLFNRSEIENGHYTSLLTGHFVHLSSYHLLINLGGLLLILLINRSIVLSIKGVVAVGFLCLWTSIAVFLFDPGIRYYGGLSGVLHGLFFLAVMKNHIYTQAEKYLLTGGLVFKIALEQSGLFGSSLIADGLRIAVDAHLYGFLGGCTIYLFHTALARFQQTYSGNNQIN